LCQIFSLAQNLTGKSLFTAKNLIFSTLRAIFKFNALLLFLFGTQIAKKPSPCSKNMKQGLARA
jgi:hypothetical protein